jgi:AraC-like DNA-binding protein
VLLHAEGEDAIFYAEAGERLEQTDDSVSSIALHCGFTDQSHLTRVFGAIVGSSPAAWRRQRKSVSILRTAT